MENVLKPDVYKKAPKDKKTQSKLTHTVYIAVGQHGDSAAYDQ